VPLAATNIRTDEGRSEFEPRLVEIPELEKVFTNIIGMN
jgi:hypothetical protein